MNHTKHEYSILFVEDDPITLKNYSLILKDKFKTVYEATEGLSAYEIYKEHKPDILIVDISIPKLNGIDLLKKIRVTDQNTKAILFTSYSDTETLLNASSLKLTQFLIKPVKSNDLFEAIDMAIKELKTFTIVTNKILNLKDDYFWDIEKNTLYKENEEVQLTKTERNILSVLFNMGNVKKIVTYDDLLYSLWDNNEDTTLRSLKTFISMLRKKLPQDLILNEYGTGYRVNIDE